MKRAEDKIHGCDKALYRIDALLSGKIVGSMEVIAYSKIDAYYTVNKQLPQHDEFDYTHIRWAGDNEPFGIYSQTPQKQ